MLPQETIGEILHHTKALAGVCFLAAHDDAASAEEVAILTATLEALHRQGTALSKRLSAQNQLVPARPGPARR